MNFIRLIFLGCFHLLSKTLLFLSLVIFLGCSNRSTNPNPIPDTNPDSFPSDHSEQEFIQSPETTPSNQNLNNNTNKKTQRQSVNNNDLSGWIEIGKELTTFYKEEFVENRDLIEDEICNIVAGNVIHLVDQYVSIDKENITYNIDDFRAELNDLQSEWESCLENLGLE